MKAPNALVVFVILLTLAQIACAIERVTPTPSPNAPNASPTSLPSVAGGRGDGVSDPGGHGAGDRWQRQCAE